MELTHERLKSQLQYNPETGDFFWLQRRRGVQTDRPAGRVSKAHGYKDICIDGVLHRAHRLAFYWMDGAWPEGVVDHINGVKHDNRWCNLRSCSQSQNMMNGPIRSNNKTGVVGVSWDKSRQRWLAQVRLNGKKKNLGRYQTKEQAMQAWVSAVSLDGDAAFRGIDGQ
jgi:hypothetical protein